jgi:predicted ATPase
MLGGLTGVPEDVVAYLVLTSGLGCYTFPDAVLVKANAHRPGSLDTGVTGLLDHGENYMQAFDAITTNLQAWSRRREMLAALRFLDPSINGVDFAMPGRQQIFVSHNVGGRALPFDLSQESEGFRRFFAHLLALYQTPSKQTLIFEEPEKGIHPGALAALADEFKACPIADRGQVILTTHSPDLLNHFAPEALRVVQIESYLTRIGPVDPDQVEAIREQLLRPGELLTVDSARLAPEAATQS